MASVASGPPEARVQLTPGSSKLAQGRDPGGCQAKPALDAGAPRAARPLLQSALEVFGCHSAVCRLR